MTKRITNLRIATIFFVAATALTIFSSFIIYSSFNQKEQNLTKVLKKQCLYEFGAYGLKATTDASGKILFSQKSAERMQETVETSSIVIGRCLGYELTDFCAGTECKNPGIFFSLSPL